VSSKLLFEPAFSWLVPWTLKKRDRIIAAVNNRFLKKTHKFGLRVPPSVKVSFDAIAKEMKNVKVAFKILDDDEVIAVGYTVPCATDTVSPYLRCQDGLYPQGTTHLDLVRKFCVTTRKRENCSNACCAKLLGHPDSGHPERLS
jgi:hypothetical protein